MAKKIATPEQIAEKKIAMEIAARARRIKTKALALRRADYQRAFNEEYGGAIIAAEEFHESYMESLRGIREEQEKKIAELSEQIKALQEEIARVRRKPHPPYTSEVPYNLRNRARDELKKERFADLRETEYDIKIWNPPDGSDCMARAEAILDQEDAKKAAKKTA